MGREGELLADRERRECGEWLCETQIAEDCGTKAMD